MLRSGFRFLRLNRLGALIGGLAAGLLVMSAAWAMRVSPMVSELTTTGAGSAARIEVGNVGGAALPFETMITRMEIDANGDVVETPADEDFLVFPPQGLVPVGGRQVVRVQWIGEPTIESSHAYYLWVKQLPVATDPTVPESGGALSVQVLYTMKAWDQTSTAVQMPMSLPISVLPISGGIFLLVLSQLSAVRFLRLRCQRDSFTVTRFTHRLVIRCGRTDSLWRALALLR